MERVNLSTISSSVIILARAIKESARSSAAKALCREPPVPADQNGTLERRGRPDGTHGQFASEDEHRREQPWPASRALAIDASAAERGAGTASTAKDHRCNFARHLSSFVSSYTKTNKISFKPTDTNER